MYDSTKDSIPLMEQKNQSVVDISSHSDFIKNPFRHDDSNYDFWEKVNNLHNEGKTWDNALTTVQAEEFKEKCDDKDPIMCLLEIHDRFVNLEGLEDRQLSGFISQFTKLGAKILQIDKEYAEANDECPVYEDPFPDSEDQTLLHILASKNLIDLCEIYVRDYYPDHLYAPTDPQMQEISVEDGNRKNAYNGPKVPFELAYEKHHDKTAAFLAGEMKPFRLRQLFERRDDGVLQCSFAEVINNDMQLTAIKVLDSCMNPDWPYVPVNPLEEDDETLCKLKDDPTSYHFYYHILDSDQSGRAPKKPVESEAEKDRFNHMESSPFQLLVTNKVTKQAAISHPTVRGLVNRKWEHFGETRVKVFLGFYILFLLMLALGLFFSEDWGSNVDSLIKLIVVIFNIVYTFEEIDQMTKEGRDYLAWTNLFDLLGILTIYALIPLYAFGEYKIYYGVASAAFILNFFRVLKFFATFEVGNYARVFMFLLKEDVWVFLQFFAVLMVAFTGAVFLALKSEMSDGGKIIDGQNETLTIWSTMLREARALAEGKEFADDYDGVYTAPLIIFLLLNMAAIIVVLSNILIGQISARYEDAAKDAKVQSDIAKAKVICKIEKSRFVWRNLRIKYYTPGDYVTDEGLVKERLSEWYELKKESDSSRDAIKKLQEGLKKSDPVPVESRVKEIQTELQATKKLLEKLLKRLPAGEDEEEED